MADLKYVTVRSGVDRVVALVLLLLASPVMLVIAIVIRIQMGRPIFFLQDRIGQGGRRFQIMKFRTMVPNAEALGGGYMPPDLNLVTQLGEFLRKWSLDELPQLINILKGDIAFVGPRPALPDQYERYTDAQARRVDVPQGLTGLAQVRHRNNAPWSVRIDTDLEYIDDMGPLIDLRIVMLTVGRVLRRTGVLTDQVAADVDDLGTERYREIG